MDSPSHTNAAIDSYALEKFMSFDRRGDRSDIDEAVREMRRILRQTPTNHPVRNGLMNNLSVILETRFDHFRMTEDMEEAIHMARSVLDATSPTHPNFPIYQISYANKLQKLFQSRRNIDDLERAIEVAREAVQNIPDDHPSIAEFRRSLSVKLAIRFETLKNRQDLTEAIRLGERALEDTPQSDPEHATMRHNLANMYENLFNLDGIADEENRAINAAREAMLATSKDHPRLPVHLTILGHNLWRRYERTGRMEDLEQAICCLQEAIDASKSPHRDSASRLNSLAAMLFTRYERLGDTQDIQGNLGKAILAAEDAIELARRNGGDLTMYQNNLSVLLVNRFKLSDNNEDLDRAIQLGDEALQREDASHYNNLGVILEQRYKRTGNREDLTKAIDYAILSVQNTPPDHRDLSGRLNNLGHRLLLESPDRQEDALQHFVRSWNNTRGTPFHRVDAARQALWLLTEQKRWNEALDVSKGAVDLLSMMNNRALSREDQEVVASKFAGLVSDACSVSLCAGEDASDALRLLERGRGSIMGLLVDDRSDLSQLEADQPQLAKKYRALRLEVNRSSQRNLAMDTRERRLGEHIDLVGSLSDCISKIRQRPGYERFLLGQTSEQLMRLATEGPLVVVNITDIRSDAFIVSPSSIKSIKLPNVTASWVRQRIILNQDKSADLMTISDRHREFLTHLWSACVQIVLQNLDLRRSTTGKPLTRVWWVGAGDACSLPFHAAGDHFRGSTKNTASQVISSYTTTLKALAYARERSRRAIRRGTAERLPRLLVVIMPDTPGEDPLENTIEEMKAILKATESVTLGVGLIKPNAQTVVSHLEQCEIAHFACHGISETASPLASYLALYKDSKQGPEVDKLTVQRICEAQLENVSIAYLSACSTAEIKAQKLNDEAIHLASGFQVAGFSHVIASLWSANDWTCVKVAQGFYERLALSPSASLHNDTVAVALHESVEAIRNNNTQNWAPFIHIGA